MNKAVWCGIVPCLVVAWTAWNDCHDLFVSSGIGFWTLILGLAIGFGCLAKDPLLMDNPMPIWYPTDLDSAMHAVKSALVNFEHNGMKWRLLQLDPEVGVLTACLDLFQWADIDGFQVPVPIRRQMLLLADFERAGKQTQVRLLWKVKYGKHRAVCNEIIEQLTVAVAYQLSSASL